jgi:chromosome segregation ATPase
MSDGKKFAPKVLASAEERLTEIERKYSVIQERIQAYDAVLSEFASLKAELKGNKNKIEAIAASSVSLFEELRAKTDTHVAQFQILHAKGESNAKALEDHKGYVSKFVASNNKIFSDFSKIVSEIKASVDPLPLESKKLSDSVQSQKISIETLASSHDSCKKSIEKLLTDHIKFKDATEASQAGLAEQHAKLAKTVSSLPSLQDWSNSLYGKIQDNLLYREKQATAYVDAKVNKLAKDFDANPLSAEGVKAALFNEIQALALDGKNAYLKSNNCATQIALLEKKLENLNLLIKKHELNK